MNQPTQPTQLFWSRRPGRFVNQQTGEVYKFRQNVGPMFTGTVREWYETLIETMYQIAEKHDIVEVRVSNDAIHTIISFSVLYDTYREELKLGEKFFRVYRSPQNGYEPPIYAQFSENVEWSFVGLTDSEGIVHCVTVLDMIKL